MILCFKA